MNSSAGHFQSRPLARPGVKLPGEGIELCLAEHGQIGALGHVLAEQCVGVLVDAALPRAMRIGEVNIDAGDCGKPLMLRHLAPLIVGQGKTPLRVDPVEDGAEAGDGRFNAGMVQPGQGHKQRGSLDQCAAGGRVASALDQITFPMAGNAALIDLRWPL